MATLSQPKPEEQDEVPDISAIVLDVDGTLLNSCGRLSQANLVALRECARRGILLYVATARPQRLVFRPREVPGDASFITERGVFYNGAVAIDRPLGFSGHWPMSAELVSAVTGYLASVAPDLQIAIQRGEDYHSFRLPVDETTLASWGFSRQELVPYVQARERKCSKIVAFHETRNLAEAHAGLVDRHGSRSNAFLTDSGLWLQVMSARASKERALLELFALRDIPAREVAVFGDDLPDLGMFATFGWSIAMGNAKSVLKEAATYVTRSNDEDGVVFALEEYLHLDVARRG